MKGLTFRLNKNLPNDWCSELGWETIKVIDIFLSYTDTALVQEIKDERSVERILYYYDCHCICNDQFMVLSLEELQSEIVLGIYEIVTE